MPEPPEPTQGEQPRDEAFAALVQADGVLTLIQFRYRSLLPVEVMEVVDEAARAVLAITRTK